MSLFSSNTDTKMKLIPGITLWGKKKKKKRMFYLICLENSTYYFFYITATFL